MVVIHCEHEFVAAFHKATIRGSHLHVYECAKCGLVDYLVEVV